ncbi:unnamed protein product [Dibothriocephalus latus]|uniref:Golgi-associated plant pathogenesis-related protein 1 n=1 Tax=Dibothriocephalus latus TaxID=60516 RepID=A0A3P6TPH9_DIBLA|nr:unnamed protein product [Dibothriocephalus latus]
MRSMSENEDFNDECLREHNRIRKNHSVKPLRHSHALDRTAQEWAENLLKKEVVTNSPLSSRGELGESISKRTSTSEAVDISADPFVAGTEVVAQWYNDINSYNFQTGAGAAGNFTQMVWSRTREVGFGKASARGQCVVVAHYRPPGNIRGRYLENVFPPICPERMQPKQTNTRSKDVWKRTYTEREVDADGNQFDVKKEVFETKDKDGNIHRRVINSYQNCDPFSMKIPENSTTSNMAEKLSQSTTATAVKHPPLVKHEEFVNGIVTTHNRYRSKHGSPELVLNSRLSTMAQEWADYLVDEICLSNSGFTVDGMRLGENISSRWSSGTLEESAKDIVDDWYKEATRFKYGTEPTSIQGIGNFTQLIWASSREIGVGRAIRVAGSDLAVSSSSAEGHENAVSSAKTVVVCFYFPPGNITTIFCENVPPPLYDAAAAACEAVSEPERT